MSRPIIFRAWSNDHNRYCDFVTLDENGRWIGWIKGSGVYLTTTDIVLEQDTGLKDKNGKKIFEGDIVTLAGETGVVERRSGSYFVVASDGMLTIMVGWKITKLKVIGNIHKNKNLLGGKNE